MKRILAIAGAALLTITFINFDGGQTSAALTSNKNITVTNKAIHRTEGQLRSSAINRAVPKYPRKAVEKKVEGDVVVEITVDEDGKVASAKAVAGPQIFYKSCEKAALQWTFQPFKVNEQPAQVAGNLSFRFVMGSLEEMLKAGNVSDE